MGWFASEPPACWPADEDNNQAKTLPRPRPLIYSDQKILTLAAQNNPELIPLAHNIRGRKQGLELAKLQYLPDFSANVGTDLKGVTQSLAASLTIPFLRYEAIDAAVAQAEANLRSTQAMRRQTLSDLNAQIIPGVVSLHDAVRQLDLFHNTLLPRARQVVAVARSVYESGPTSLLALLDSERSLIAIQRLTANLRVTREKNLVDLEASTTRDLSKPDDSSPLHAAH